MNKFKTLPILFSICLITLSCQKNPFDERSKFIGDYIFSIQQVSWNINGFRKDTSYTYNGKIEYGKERKKLSIFFIKHHTAEPKLYEDWSIIGDGVEGEFHTTDALGFSIRYGGLGGGSIYNVIGDKNK